MTSTRRSFLASSLGLGLGSGLGRGTPVGATTQLAADGFFTLAQRQGRWWLITPKGEPFFSIGLNHIDPASLRYPENVHLWRDKYGGSTLRWIRESVAPNLKRWGFNTVGWVQEVTVRRWRHSRPFTHEEYRALEMPYCHLLPFTESHQWEQHTRHFDFRSAEWKEWVDYVARSHCAELSEDPNLIGYFYSDCPTWVHSRPQNAWRGPIFDPNRLKKPVGRTELVNLATHYYQTIHDAIRRYDPHHLLLGDRYEANAPLPAGLVQASVGYVDVLSFQDFRKPVAQMDTWHQVTGRPVLMADGAGLLPADASGFIPNNGEWYANVLAGLFRNPGCVGFHFCGAYQRNKARRRGLLDELENPDQANIDLMQAAIKEVVRQIDERF